MSFTRRDFISQSIAAAATWSLMPESITADEHSAGNLRLASFRFDVTPPMGHGLCGGWIKPVLGVDDPLEAIGIVILGAGKPIVLCAVDWTGISNDAHLQWRTALAEAAGTTADRVAVHCVHQHNAPLACVDTEKIILAQGDLPHVIELDFFKQCLGRARTAVAKGLKRTRPITHIAHGQGKVEKVASNRRIFRDKDGKIKSMRGSSCKNEKLRAMTEGLIDPWLKTVAFYDNKQKIASCHYYATHPMSYYGDGQVSSDFAGLARKKRQAKEPHCTHMYFTGCAGNIAAGKYNDGTKPMRAILADRMYEGIVRSEENLQPTPVNHISWRTADLLPTPNPKYSIEELEKEINNRSSSVVARNRPSYTLSWLRRLEKKIPIILSSLELNNISLLHLPGEPFIQYQLRAQNLASSRFVATAGYGDEGPWYIPIEEEYPKGGYEVSVAFCDTNVDSAMTAGIKSIIG